MFGHLGNYCFPTNYISAIVMAVGNILSRVDLLCLPNDHCCMQSNIGGYINPGVRFDADPMISLSLLQMHVGRYVCGCVHMYVEIHGALHACMHACMYACVVCCVYDVITYVCIHVCACARAYACMYVRVYVNRTMRAHCYRFEIALAPPLAPLQLHVLMPATIVY